MRFGGDEIRFGGDKVICAAYIGGGGVWRAILGGETGLYLDSIEWDGT